jgi:hypothetical protein
MAGIRCLISSVGWRGPPTLYDFSPGSISGVQRQKALPHALHGREGCN